MAPMWLKISSLILALSAVHMASGCTNKTAPEVAQMSCDHQTPLEPGIPGSPGHLIAMAHNPNGVTELAHIMRSMLISMKEARSALSEGTEPAKLPDYTKIKCSWPTDSHTRSARFDAMADALVEAVALYNKKATPTSYNGVVSTCLACHQTTCPGPMAAIRPLYWTDGQPALLELPEPESCEHPAP